MLTMPSFTPPSEPQAVDGPFWGRFAVNVGVSVVKVGGHFVLFPFPQPDDLVGLDEGVGFFRGGYVYPIPPELGDALIADGFDVDMGAGYGYGGYGEEGYGE